jgi:hypothetical protein
MWNALRVWYMQGVRMRFAGRALIMGRKITERIAERVVIFRELSSKFDFDSYRLSI